MRHFG
jgi:putative ABC transport system substrate-binding protein